MLVFVNNYNFIFNSYIALYFCVYLFSVMVVLKMSWTLSATVLIIVCACFKEIRPSCVLIGTKSNETVYGHFYDEFDNYVCCNYHHKTIYETGECFYISLIANQDLQDLFINFSDESEESDASQMGDATTIKYLKFKSSNVPTIYASLFSNFKIITELDMSKTGVELIQPGAFNELSLLQELKLPYNYITQVSRGTLNHLSTLVTLNMSSNYISVIEDGAFMGLKHLEHLILKDNRLVSFSLDVFWDLEFIIFLDVSHNVIANLHGPERGLHLHNNRSFELNLSHNNLTLVNTTYIPLAVTDLSLDYNNISKFIDFSLLRLDYLSLSYNNIPNVTVNSMLAYLDLRSNSLNKLQHMFENSEGLQTLYLDGNSIDRLDGDIFAHSTNLNYLSLNNNQLDKIPLGCFSNLSNLTFLNISGNKITEFEHGTFSGLKNLVTLDISNNSLSYLYESTFHPLISLETLNMHHNFITTFDPYELLNNIKSLKTISLNYNRWNCKSLLHIFSHLQSKGVTVSEGMENKVGNVYGISCNNDIPTVSSNKGGIDVPVFNGFLNEGFLNSSFYQFFKNYSNADFAEKAFLNNFQKTFENLLKTQKNEILNSTFIQHLNETISKFSMDFTLLPGRVTNSSDQFNERLSNYFNGEFNRLSAMADTGVRFAFSRLGHGGHRCPLD